MDDDDPIRTYEDDRDASLAALDVHRGTGDRCVVPACGAWPCDPFLRAVGFFARVAYFHGPRMRREHPRLRGDVDPTWYDLLPHRYRVALLRAGQTPTRAASG